MSFPNPLSDGAGSKHAAAAGHTRDASIPASTAAAPLTDSNQTVESNQPTTKGVIILSVQGRDGAQNSDTAAAGDVLRLVDTLQADLQNPDAANYLLTDTVQEKLNQKDLGLEIRTMPPTLRSLELAFANIAGRLKPGGELIFWFGGHGGNNRGTQFLQMQDPNEHLTPKMLRTWLAKFDPSVNVIIYLDACFSGRFLSLPYHFNLQGQLDGPSPDEAPWTGPRVICVAACQRDELAYLMKSNNNVMHGSLAWWLPKLLEDRTCTVFLGRIMHLLSPVLSGSSWQQRPQVDMTHANKDAKLLPGLQVSTLRAPGIPPRN